MWEHDWTPEQRSKLEEWLAFIRRNGGEVPKIQSANHEYGTVRISPYAEDGSYPSKAQVDQFINRLERMMKP